LPNAAPSFLSLLLHGDVANPGEQQLEALRKGFQEARGANRRQRYRVRATLASREEDGLADAWDVHQPLLHQLYETDSILRGYRMGEIVLLGSVNLRAINATRTSPSAPALARSCDSLLS
jgi:hypothetical protein